MSQSLGRSSSFGPDMGRRIIKQVRQIRSISFRRSFESAVHQNSPPAMRDLQEFLAEADLGEYYHPLMTRLKVSNIEHLKYVQEEDLEEIGMTRPEMRRLKKFYRKEFPQGTFSKIRKAILRGGGDGSNSSRTLSPSPPEHRSSKSGSPSISAPSTPGHQHPPCRQLIPSDALVFHQTLGEGDFGVVLQATWTVPESGEKLPVAVKKLLRDRVSNGSQTFLKEAAITQDVQHDSIVRLYGVVLDQDQDIMLVTELAPMRSLLECLRDESLRGDLNLPRLCDFAQQVCEGMTYLEAKRMVHRDLAARNVLVFNKSQVKISDLGLSRALGVGQDYYQSSSCTSAKLPLAWCAPECINFLKFTSFSDVWSFGVMLWEFFTYGQQPWEDMDNREILEAVDSPSSQRLPQPELCTPEYYQMLLSCWAHTPEERPQFGALLIQLPQLRPTQVRAIKDYPKPTVDPGHICYKTGDVIVVVDKTPSTNAPTGLVWRGVLMNGACGLFDPTHVVPFIEPKISPLAVQKTSLARKESGRKSSRKIRADMISRPHNDLRHTGHIGYDGAVFGDVSFIGNNYDKLPVRVDGDMGGSRGVSMVSIPANSSDNANHVRASNSQDSLDNTGHNGLEQSWMSRESLSSQATMETEGRRSPSYLDVEDDSLFSDFKMPDLGSSLDFGGSFMDEVLKALDAKEKEVSSKSNTSDVPSSDFPYSEVRAVEAPVPAPRESKPVPPLPSQPPRTVNEPTREKKQAKVKPMSTSDERIMETALANARELTALRSPGESHSPTVNEKSHFFNDESPGIVSKLRNSLRRSTSPKTERKRTFSDELESKGDIADELTPEAQQAYNILVVKGENSSNGRQNDQKYYPEPDLRSSSEDRHLSKDHDEDSVFAESNHQDIKRMNESPPRVPSSNNTAHPNQNPPLVPTRPLISAPQLQSKPVAVTHPTTNAAPVPVPRPPKPDNKKSELPIPKPRPEIQRVEPTIRHMVPESPELDHKSQIPISRKDSSSASKEKEREDFKKTIEIVRVEDTASLRDEWSEKNSSAFDRSSARSSQRSSLDRSDVTSENAESERADCEQSEYSSDGSKPDHRANSSFGSTDRQDSFNKKQSSSLFEEDLSEPSPQEIMSRLRERRLNRHLDHQRITTGEGEGSLSATTNAASRPRPNAREPQGIPGRTPSVDQEDGGGGEGSEEVEMNPLRMLRGGAIPIRTGRGSAGNHGNQGTRGAKALRVPSLNFSSPLSRQTSSLSSSSLEHHTTTIQPQSESPLTSQAKEYCTDDSHQNLQQKPTSTVSATNAMPSSSENASGAAADILQELDKLTSTLMEGNLAEVASAVAGRRASAEEEIRKFAAQGHKMDLAKSIPSGETLTHIGPVYYDRSLVSVSSSNPSTTDYNSNFSKAVKSTTPVVVNPLTPPAIPQRPNLPATATAKDTPPRLPPRRTQSLSENPEKIYVAQPAQQRSRELRRSNSLEEPDLCPPLPPRAPQSCSNTVPLNSKPRERKFPLLMHPNVKSGLPVLSKSVSVCEPQPLPPRSPLSPSFAHPQLYHSRSVESSHHTSRVLSPHNRSFDSCHRPLHSRSFELPPTADLPFLSDIDSEPTHMLLESPPSHCNVPSLVVNLPSALDFTCKDEPTHIPLSWSSSFPSSPPPSSPQKRSTSNVMPSVSRSNSWQPAPPFISRYPSITNQSPPADLPPAPPTPSYRDKLGFSNSKKSVFAHSISHDTAMKSSLPGQPPPLSPRNPSTIVNNSSSSHMNSSSGRRRSSSMTSPRAQQNTPFQTQHPSQTSSHPLVSPLRTTQNPRTVFKYPSFPPVTHNTELGDDDAFFSEAPSVPCPYSQSPFHPIVSDKSSAVATTTTTTNPQSIPKRITSLHPNSAFQLKGHSLSSIQDDPSNDIPPPISPRTTSRGIVNPFNMSSDPSSGPALPPRSPIPATTSPPLSPPSTSKDVYLHLSSASSSPTHAPLPSPAVLNASGSEEDSNACRSPSRSPPPPMQFKYASKSTESQNVLTPRGLHPNRGLSSPPPPSSQKINTSSAAAASVATVLPMISSSSASSSQPSSSLPQDSSHLTTREYGEVDLSPTMLMSYKNSSTVSYEDLMEFALDRQKNCEEIETLLNIFQKEVTVEECMVALESTKWDVTKATKYIQLKKLLCIGIADVHRCKESLVACGWDVERAAEALLDSAGRDRNQDSTRPSSSSSSSSRSSSSLASSSSLSLSSSARVSPARSQGNRSSTGGEGGGGEGGELLSSAESSSSSSFGNSNNNPPPSPETVDV